MDVLSNLEDLVLRGVLLEGELVYGLQVLLDRRVDGAQHLAAPLTPTKGHFKGMDKKTKIESLIHTAKKHFG